MVRWSTSRDPVFPLSVLCSTALYLHAGLMLIGERRGADIPSPSPRVARVRTANSSTSPPLMMSADRVKPEPGAWTSFWESRAEEARLVANTQTTWLVLGLADTRPY
jgi:hypothetical protein